MTPGVLQIDFWNVGQGDASSILIEETSNAIVLDVIDVGPSGNQFAAWICSQRSKKIIIRNLILTHNDSDHINGLLSILRVRNVTIERALLLDDRETGFPSDSAIGMLISSHKEVIRRLEKSEEMHILDEFGDYQLIISYPSAADNMFFHGSPNETSAIIQLLYSVQESPTAPPLITWGEDNKMKAICEYTGANPQMLFGPHHGCPQDKSKLDEYVCRLSPKKCFLSFATINAYGHPKTEYIRMLSENNCEIICSQCAKHCKKERKCPIFDGDGYYCLTVPCTNKENVACHGHLRLLIDGNTVRDDLASEYEEAKREAAPTLCMMQ